ncbi:MAG: hypothetical protein LBF09_01710 [Odoribacteraceae bacterium]|nr:hypothetical protein [Odoribacteraceae bacterium]
MECREAFMISRTLSRSRAAAKGKSSGLPVMKENETVACNCHGLVLF